MGIGMTGCAVVVTHEVRGIDVLARCRSRQRREEIDVGWVRALVRFGQDDANHAKADGYGRNRGAHRPPYGAAGEAVQHEQPACQRRGGDMRPVGDVAPLWVAQLDGGNAPREGEPAHEQHDGATEQRKPESHGQSIGPPPRPSQMHDTVDQYRRDDGQTQDEVQQEDQLVGPVLEFLAGEPLPEGDRAKPDRVDDKQREQC